MTDRQTDGLTDGGDCNIPDAFLKKRGDNKAYDMETWQLLMLIQLLKLLVGKKFFFS